VSKLDKPKIVKEICDRLSGGEGIWNICQDKHMPSKTMVYQKMANDEKFRTVITQAREAQQEYEADNCVNMADGANADNWQVIKMQIWARQWRAGKLAPKKYGDKLHTEESGTITVVIDKADEGNL